MLTPDQLTDDVNLRELLLPLLQAQAKHCAHIIVEETSRWTADFISDDGTDDVTNSTHAVEALTFLCYEGTAEDARTFLFGEPDADAHFMPVSALSCAVCNELAEYADAVHGD